MRMIASKVLCRKSSSPSSRKRQRLPSSHETPDAVLNQSKKQKLRHPEFPPTQFWERLSKIPLTRNALRALDEQSTQGSRPPGETRTGRSLRPRPHSISGVGQVVDTYSPTSLKSIKVFARHGGPDLSDLQGVCKNPAFRV